VQHHRVGKDVPILDDLLRILRVQFRDHPAPSKRQPVAKLVERLDWTYSWDMSHIWDGLSQHPLPLGVGI
jgi:hypothetical protein